MPKARKKGADQFPPLEKYFHFYNHEPRFHPPLVQGRAQPLESIVARDFFISVTASFGILHVFVAWRSARGACCIAR